MSFRTKFDKLFNPWGENTDNSRYELLAFKKDRPIYGVYHIYAFNNWQEIVSEQLDNLWHSPLWKLTERLYVSIIADDEENIDKIKEMLMGGGKNHSIINITNDKSAFEFPALDFMKELADKTDDFYVYYFHTKGASYTIERVDLYKREGISNYAQIVKNGREWRRMMEYWLFNRYTLAIKTLQDGYDTYGIKLYDVSDNLRYYAGNFWWAKSEYIRSKDPISPESKSWRWTAETWLLSGKVKCYNAFRCDTNLLAVYAPECLYNPGSNALKNLAQAASFYIHHLLFLGKMLVRRCFHF